MKKKLFVITLALTILFSQGSIYADDKPKEEPTPLNSFEMSTDGQESLLSAQSFMGNLSMGNIDLTSLITQENGSISTGLNSVMPNDFNQLWTSVAGAEVKNIGNVNLNFTALQTNLQALNFSEDYSIKPENFNIGYSNDITNLFKTTFGSFSGTMTTELPEIPKNFNLNSMLNGMNTKRNNALSDAYSTNSFQIINENNGYTSLFNQASNPMSMPSLMSSSDMANSLSAGDTWAQNNANSKYNDQSSSFNKDKQDAQNSYNNSRNNDNNLTLYQQALANSGKDSSSNGKANKNDKSQFSKASDAIGAALTIGIGAGIGGASNQVLSVYEDKMNMNNPVGLPINALIGKEIKEKHGEDVNTNALFSGDYDATAQLAAMLLSKEGERREKIEEDKDQELDSQIAAAQAGLTP